MKLIRFVSTDPSNPSFGIVIANHVVSFSVLQAKTGTLCEFLSDSQAYLAHLPDSEQAARTLLEWGEEHFQEIDEGERFALHATQLKEPIEVAALFDFGLTPRYVKELVRDDDEVREARPADLFNIQPRNNKISVRISRNQRKY